MSKSGQHSELEEIVTNLENIAGSGTVVFRTTDLPEDQVVLWDGSDFKEFLEVFHKFEGKVLYLRQEPIQVEEDAPGHVGELARVDVGFLDHGLFHVFRKMEEWWQDMLLERGLASMSSLPDGSQSSELLGELDNIIEDMTKEIPARIWTKSMVSDYCIEKSLPRSHVDRLYGRIKRNVARKGVLSGDHEKGEEHSRDDISRVNRNPD